MKSFLSKYASHLAGYVVAGATIVSGLNPGLLPPRYAFLTALAGLVVTGASHGFTAGQVSAAVNAAATAVAKAPVAAVLAFLMVLGTSAGLTGCATVQGFFASSEAPVVITVSVDVAVAAAEQHGVKASDINAIAKIALTANQSTTATVGTVSAVVNAQVAKLNLPPLDIAAAQALEAVVSATIQAKLAGNPDVATAQADVAQVLQAVIVATGG
jgi:hypothetical protein